MGTFADWTGSAGRITVDGRYADRSHSFDGPSAGVRARVGPGMCPSPTY